MGDMRKHWYDPTGRRKKPAGEASAETADDQSEDEVEADSTFLNPGSLADSVNRLFCPEYTPHWEQFASTKWYNEGSFDTFTGFLSLEYIHNNVHVSNGKTDRSDLKFGSMLTMHFRTSWEDLTSSMDWVT
jgi:hypothetical protein